MSGFVRSVTLGGGTAAHIGRTTRLSDGCRCLPGEFPGKLRRGVSTGTPRSRRLCFGIALAALVLATAAGCGNAQSSSGPVTLNWYIFPEFSGAFVKSAASCSKASNGAYTIKIQTLPNAADGQRQQMVRRLAADDSSLDILGLDVTWTPEFAEAGWITPWPQDLAQKVEDGTLQSMVDTATWNNRLYSAPFNTNTQLLWYRKDLVPNPPKTWKQMIAMATALAKQGKPHYIEIQGAQYEGYTVWFNTLVNSAGGQIVSDDGQRVTLEPLGGDGARHDPRACQFAGRRPLARKPDGGPDPAPVRGGRAAFELNYPYVYPSAKADVPDIFKNMAWTVYPTVKPGEPTHVTIGGIDLAVGAFSKHKQQAFDAIQCLRSPQNEIQNAVLGGLPPVARIRLQRSQVPEGVPDVEGHLRHAEAGQRAAQDAGLPERVAADLLHPLAAELREREDLGTLRGRIEDAINSKGLVP